MKQYTTPEQTAKLIELGFEKPSSIASVEPIYGMGGISVAKDYSIGELIEMLPMIIGKDYGYTLSIYMGGAWWIVAYDNGDEYTTLYSIIREELVDALFDMVVKTKEEE